MTLSVSKPEFNLFCLCIYVQFLSLLALLTAALTIGHILSLEKEAVNLINGDHHLLGLPDTPDLVDKTERVSGWLILSGLMVLVYEGVVISLRFLNIGFINKHIVIWILAVK